MVKGCAVPKCRTGCRSVKQKCSVFRVPRNVEQYKKWLEAIPGLKQSQYVCEKHFEKQCIVRHWRKEDANGRIIAESPYTHPKLSEFAVPTIFEENVVQKSTGSIVNRCAQRETDQVLRPVPISKLTDESMIPLPIDVPNAESAHDTLDEGLSPKPSIKQEDIPSESVPVLEMEITVEEKFVPPQESIQPEISLPNKCAGREVFPSIPTVVTNTRSASAHATHFEISDMTLNVHSSKVPANLGISREKTSISIPKLWSITESSTEDEQRIIFSYVVAKVENGVVVPVIAKSVMFTTKKSLSYSVFGRAINPEECKLEMILNDVTQLPGILERFKNMNICNGLGAVNLLHLRANGAFQDSVGRWHQNDCPLVSKRKRCDHCIKMRNLILKKEMRSKDNRPLLRVSRASNPMDEKKLLALRNKSYRDRRLKNRAKQRGQLLRQSLIAKAEEIASIRVETLQKKCSHLIVPSAQKIELAKSSAL